MKVYMKCSYTPHSIISIWIETWKWIWSMGLHGVWRHYIISIWIQTWIWIQSMDLHGVWRHFTFHNIHMDMDIATSSHIITITYSSRPLFFIGNTTKSMWNKISIWLIPLSLSQLFNWCIEIFLSYLDLINNFIFGTFEIIYLIYTTNT